MTNIMTNDARNPPTFTIPFAEPRLRSGLKVRAKSKPISEPGPPIAMTTTSRMTLQTGGWPGHASTIAQAIPMARHDAEHDRAAPQREARGQQAEDRARPRSR